MSVQVCSKGLRNEFTSLRDDLKKATPVEMHCRIDSVSKQLFDFRRSHKILNETLHNREGTCKKLESRLQSRETDFARQSKTLQKIQKRLRQTEQAYRDQQEENLEQVNYWLNAISGFAHVAVKGSQAVIGNALISTGVIELVDKRISDSLENQLDRGLIVDSEFVTLVACAIGGYVAQSYEPYLERGPRIAAAVSAVDSPTKVSVQVMMSDEVSD